jgi:hypothetical protein
MGHGKKQELFQTFSTNLSFFNPEVSGMFVCPLCLSAFRSDSKGYPNELSAAHIWPQSLGGRQTTATCMDCNHYIGRSIESYEFNRAKLLTAVFGTGQARLNVSIQTSSGEKVNAVLSNEFDPQLGQVVKRVQISARHSKPEALKQLREDMETFGPGSNLSFNHRGMFHEDRATLTYLHAAYLAMFHFFGYEWVASPCTEVIRQQLLNPAEQLITTVTSPVPPSSTFVSDTEFELWFLHHPTEWIGFLFFTPQLPHYDNRRLAVWLPAFSSEYNPPKTPLRDAKVFGPLRVNHEMLRRPDAPSLGKRVVQGILHRFSA